MGAGKPRDGAFNLTFFASRPLFLLCQLRLEGQGQLATVRAYFLTIFLFSSPFLSLTPPLPLAPRHSLGSWILSWSSCQSVLGLGFDLSRQVGLQLQREDQADLGGRGHL